MINKKCIVIKETNHRNFENELNRYLDMNYSIIYLKHIYIKEYEEKWIAILLSCDASRLNKLKDIEDL